ncbi:MAG: hypothetical protein OXU63_18180 [Acidobacteriota bacterium]|nr:hypothetical protein [Acidobacteriota bacterium]
MKDTLYSFLLAMAVLTGIAILVVGSAMLGDAFAVGVLVFSVALLTCLLRTEVKVWRKYRESVAARDKLAADNARSR